MIRRYPPLSWAVALALLTTAACTTDARQIREGLWEIRGESTENPGGKKGEFQYQLCRNHALDRQANAKLKDVRGCSTVVKDQGAGRYASSSTCKVAGTTIVSSGITHYLDRESTHSETQATYDPPFNGKSSEILAEDQRYVGPCPAGMAVGDILGPDGLVRHHPLQ